MELLKTVTVYLISTGGACRDGHCLRVLTR